MRLPEILCPKTISWDLSSLDALSAVWANCARISLLETVSGQQPRWGTEVRLGWNGKALHGLFICQDLIPWATETKPGGALWEEEAVEIFLDPFGDAMSYFEIGISTLNTVTDFFIRRTRTGLNKDSSWHCEGLATACGILMYGWVAAFQIPFESLGDCHPRRSPIWRANFARIDRPNDQVRERTAWSPTLVHSFHVPDRFGIIQFDGA
jgi:Carbohydrate family 9 binding domain-like